MRLAQGTIIDNRYEVISCLGSGGMSVVYKVLQKDLDRVVALKILGNRLTASEQEQARLQREAMALSSLKHRSIVGFYGFGFWNGFPYIVMEYAAGTTLLSELRAGPLSVERTIRIMQQVCEAVGAAHKHGIVHRDLKPSNIMLVEQNGNEVPKIIDFGLAFLLPTFNKDLQRITEEGLSVGSALYMSPEQCVGAPVNSASDIYSIGAVMQHCMTGSPPFFGDDAVEVMMAHMNSPPPALVEVFPEGRWPAGLQQVIYRSLSKVAEDRYPSAEELLADLNLVATGRGDKVKTPLPPSRRQKKLRGFAAVGTVALALSLLCCAVVAFMLWRPSSETASTKTGSSARDLYYEAIALKEDGQKSQQRDLLKQALAENESQRTLEGFSLLDAQTRLFCDFADLSQPEDARAEAVKILHNPWVSNLPIVDKISLYERLGFSFEFAPKQPPPDSASWDAGRELIEEHIRSELKVPQHIENSSFDVSDLYVPLARMAKTPAEMSSLLSEVKEKFPRNSRTLISQIRMVTCGLKFKNPESWRIYRGVCEDAVAYLKESKVKSPTLAEALVVPCFALEMYADVCYLAPWINADDAPVAIRVRDLVILCGSLENQNRHGDTAPLLAEAKRLYAEVNPAERVVMLEYLYTHCVILFNHHRAAELEIFKRDFGLTKLQSPSAAVSSN